jgi:two-component system KDP operon response regulator KdpE
MPQVRKILVVDDEPRMVQLISLNLKMEGFTVISASDGHQALEKVTKEMPDLIILDIMMPDMDGFETLKRIREISAARHLFKCERGGI